MTLQGEYTEDLKRGYDIVCIKNGNTVVFSNSGYPYNTRTFYFDPQGYAQQLANTIQALNNNGRSFILRRNDDLPPVRIGRCG